MALALHKQRLVSPNGLATELGTAVTAIIDRTPLARTAFICHRPSGRRPYRLVLLPAGFDGATGALLRIDDPDAQALGPGWKSALRDAYGLSPMEADLAEHLLAECSLDEIAACRGVTRETVRTQLKSLFLKTGINRQSALVKLLTTFPAEDRHRDVS
jgi:DNA-binding CsgD family transcriptional regulator